MSFQAKGAATPLAQAGLAGKDAEFETRELGQVRARHKRAATLLKPDSSAAGRSDAEDRKPRREMDGMAENMEVSLVVIKSDPR